MRPHPSAVSLCQLFVEKFDFFMVDDLFCEAPWNASTSECSEILLSSLRTSSWIAPPGTEPAAPGIGEGPLSSRVHSFVFESLIERLECVIDDVVRDPLSDHLAAHLWKCISTAMVLGNKGLCQTVIVENPSRAELRQDRFDDRGGVRSVSEHARRPAHLSPHHCFGLGHRGDIPLHIPARDLSELSSGGGSGRASRPLSDPSR